MKKIIYLALIIIIIIGIYFIFNNKKNIITVIGNTNLNNLEIDNKIEANDIDELNSKIYNNDDSLKKVIRESSILILNIGNNKINSIIENSSNIYKDIDELLGSYVMLFSQIKKYNTKKIIVMGFFNEEINNKYVEYANNGIKNIINSNNVCFLDINNILFKNKVYLKTSNDKDLEVKILISKHLKNYINNIFNNNTCQI